ITETPESVEIVITNSRGEATVDLALRRLRKFEAKPGQELTWKGTGSALRRGRGEALGPQQGTVVVDEDGTFVLRGLKVSRDVALTVKVTRGK
ncbi:MAG: hypothetical protein WBF17_21685, partial [Phycisphaerae bacterium]